MTVVDKYANITGTTGTGNAVINKNTGTCLEGGRGYDTFEDVKKVLGPAGENKAWHHIVEQNQIYNSRFDAKDIHNTKNLISIDSGFSGSIHSKISGHYSSKPKFTGGKTVREWLSGQSFEKQFEYGMDLLKQYGNVIPTELGWEFIPF